MTLYLYTYTSLCCYLPVIVLRQVTVLKFDCPSPPIIWQSEIRKGKLVCPVAVTAQSLILSYHRPLSANSLHHHSLRLTVTLSTIILSAFPPFPSPPTTLFRRMTVHPVALVLQLLLLLALLCFHAPASPLSPTHKHHVGQHTEGAGRGYRGWAYSLRGHSHPEVEQVRACPHPPLSHLSRSLSVRSFCLLASHALLPLCAECVVPAT